MSFVIIHEIKGEWKYLWFSTRTSFSKRLANYTVYTKHVLLNLAFHTVSRAVKKSSSCSELLPWFQNEGAKTCSQYL